MFAPKAGNDQQAILVESFRFFAGEFPGNGLAQNPDGLAAVLHDKSFRLVTGKRALSASEWKAPMKHTLFLAWLRLQQRIFSLTISLESRDAKKAILDSSQSLALPIERRPVKIFSSIFPIPQ